LRVAIAGGLDDNPGTSITRVIETVAAAIKERYFKDGREFELIEHYPDTISGRAEPTFQRVHFTHADTGEPSPRWEWIDDIEEVAGGEVKLWPRAAIPRVRWQASGASRCVARSPRARPAADRLWALLEA
jgi:hypothetical protein